MQGDKCVQEVDAQTLVEINHIDQGELVKKLFVGRISRIEVKRVAETYYLLVEALSCTCDLDFQKQNRSFQDQGIIFKKLVEEVVSDKDALFIDTVTQGKTLGTVVIQYQETAWEFLKRMASREPFQSGLVPEATADKPKFWFGIPEGKSYTEQDLESSAYYSVRKRLFNFRDAKANWIADITDKDFTYYEVESYKPLQIGDTVNFRGHQFVVGQVTAVLQQNLLHYQNVLVPKDGLKQKPCYNPCIAGAQIGGKVIAVEQDRLKVHLEIDREQPVDRAYLFPYSTAYSAEGNTGWYCMPELNDKVLLYFPTNREEEGVIISALRSRDNSGQVREGDKITDPQIKYFRTKDNKELSFKERELVVSGKDEAIYIRLEEGKGVEISSDREIAIEADQEIAIHSENTVCISAEQAIEIKCKESQINLNGMTGMTSLDASRVNKDPGRPAVRRVPQTAAQNLQTNPALGQTAAGLPALNALNGGAGLNKIEKGIHCANGDPVNVASGNFFTRHTDLTIEGYHPLEFSRFYNSLTTTAGAFGTGWRHNYEIQLENPTKDKVRVIFADGHNEEFFESQGRFEAASDSNSRLEKAKDGTWQLTQADGSQFVFDSAGRLFAIADLQGNRIELTYQGKQLLKVHNKCGSLQLSYDQKGLLTQLTDATGRSVVYEYTGEQLTGFRDVEGHRHAYHYDEAGLLTQLIDPLGNVTIANTYDAHRRVIAQVMADGTRNTFDYDDDQRLTCYTERNGALVIYKRDEKDRIYEREYINGTEKFLFNNRDQVIRFEDRNGNQYHYEYDENGNIVKETDPLGQVTFFGYDSNNNVTMVKNPDGSIYRYRYDAKGNMLSTVDPLGREVKLEYNGLGLPVKVVLPNGATLAIAYDAQGNPATFRDPEGNVTQYRFDALNRLKKIIKPEGNTIEYQYTSSGKVRKVTFPDGTCTTAVYDAKGLLIEETDEAGSVTKYKYNAIGKVSERIDALGGVTKYEYDAMWNITAITKPDGGIIRYKYNLANLLTEVIDETGNVRKYEYDNNGNLIKVIDGNGGVTIYEYDALDRAIKTVNARNAITRYEYRFDGKVRQIIDALNGVTEYDYDAAGQLVGVRDASGAVWKYEYNFLGLVQAVTNPEGGVTRYQYNANGKIIQVTHPDQSVEKLEYDRNNNLIRHFDQKGNQTIFSYDCRDRLVSIKNAAGGVKKLEYTPTGKLAALTDENGNRTQYRYDPLNRLTEVEDANGNRTVYGYDPVGNLTEVRQYQGVTPATIAAMNLRTEAGYRSELTEIITKYKYDQCGRLLTEINPAGKLTVYRYDANGNLISKTDRDGYETRFAYDAVNNLTKVSYADGKTVEYTYNLLNQVTGMQDWLGTTQYELDALGRVLKVKDYQGRITQYSWSRTGEKTAITYPDDSKVDYAYDPMGRLIRVNEGKGVTKYQYDPLGNLVQKVLPNGCKTNYEYDLLSRIIRQTDVNSNGKVVEEFRYTYDAAGNRLSSERKRDLTGFGPIKDETIGLTQYKYDALNQLIEVKKPDSHLERYFYDTLGNRVRKEHLVHGSILESATQYRYDLQNRLTEIHGKGEVIVGETVNEPVRLEYDQRGNLTRMATATKLLAEYTFDAANKLVRSVNHLGLVSNYTYDGADRRVKLEVELPQAPVPESMVPGGRQHRPEVTQGNLKEMLRKELSGVYDELLEAPERKVEYHYVTDVTALYNDVLMVYGQHQTQRYTYGLDVLAVDVVRNSGNDNGIPNARGISAAATAINPERTYFIQNELGSPIRLLDETGKASKAVYSYDAFGRPVLAAAPAVGKKGQGSGNIFSFTGYQSDPSGLMFAQARYYMPVVGRFVSEDVIRGWLDNPISLNRYDYCWGNPFKYVDRDGLKPGYVYKTKDQAAKAWANDYNGTSIKNNKEYLSPIYEAKDTKGNVGYMYTAPDMGDEDSASSTVDPNRKLVAYVHSHGAYDSKYKNNEFSSTDIETAEKFRIDAYVATPSGKLKKYDFNTKRITTISDKIPSDPNDPESPNYKPKSVKSPEPPKPKKPRPRFKGNSTMNSSKCLVN